MHYTFNLRDFSKVICGARKSQHGWERQNRIDSLRAWLVLVVWGVFLCLHHTQMVVEKLFTALGPPSPYKSRSIGSLTHLVHPRCMSCLARISQSSFFWMFFETLLQYLHRQNKFRLNRLSTTSIATQSQTTKWFFCQALSQKWKQQSRCSCSRRTSAKAHRVTLNPKSAFQTTCLLSEQIR